MLPESSKRLFFSLFPTCVLEFLGLLGGDMVSPKRLEGACWLIFRLRQVKPGPTCNAAELLPPLATVMGTQTPLQTQQSGLGGGGARNLSCPLHCLLSPIIAVPGEPSGLEQNWAQKQGGTLPK